MMDYHRMAEIQKRNAGSAMNNISLPRTGIISSYDAAKYAVKVLIQPENIESNWMPLGTIGVGNGWGVVVGPQLGDQVKIGFSEGDFNSPYVLARVFSTAATPPTVNPGEMLVQHSSGSLLKFNADGSVSLTGSGTITVKSPTIILENAGSALTNLVKSTFLAFFNSHTHSSSGTGPPVTAATSTLQTSTVQAE